MTFQIIRASTLLLKYIQLCPTCRYTLHTTQTYCCGETQKLIIDNLLPTENVIKITFTLHVHKPYTTQPILSVDIQCRHTYILLNIQLCSRSSYTLHTTQDLLHMHNIYCCGQIWLFFPPPGMSFDDVHIVQMYVNYTPILSVEDTHALSNSMYTRNIAVDNRNKS